MAHVISPERSSRGPAPGASYWLSSKILNQPMALPLAQGANLQAALKANAFDPSVALGPMASKFIGKADATSRFRVTEDGIALVPVGGMLLDRGEWMGDLYGIATTYEGLAEQFRRLAKDEAVKSVVLDIDSPGGMVAGCFDLVQGELAQLKKKKKVYAIAANMAASAAYAIGCSAHELYTTKFGCIGSIGVIMLHQSYERLLEGAGVETTIIQAGSHKSDGNPFFALSHGARTEMSAECDQAFQLFVSHVAQSRGLEEGVVKATEARCLYGKEAVSAGLADGVKSIDDLLKHIRNGSTKSSTKKAGRGSNASTGGRMSTDNSGTGERPDYDAVIAASLATLAAASKPAAATPAQTAPAPAATAPAAAPVDVAAAERTRIAAIVDSDDGKANPSLAAHFAFKTAMSADDAVAALKAAGPAAAVTAAAQAPTQQAQLGNALAARMGQSGTVAGIKPDAGTSDASPSAGLKPLGDVFAERFASTRKTKRA